MSSAPEDRPTTIFLGSPEAALPTLEVLAERTRLAAVVTRPSRRQGRGRTLLPTPVGAWALDHGVDIHTPHDRQGLSDIDFEVDLAVVVGFGMIIPEDLLAVPRRGFVNLHFSLLPSWRGAAPVERAILAGDERSGVCLMQMDAGLDTGPLLGCRSREIGRADAAELTHLLAKDGADLLADSLDGITTGAIEARPQEGPATYAGKLEAGEGLLGLTSSATELDRRIRAFTPRPGAWFETTAGRLKVWSAEPSEEALSPGQWQLADGRVLLGTGSGTLHLVEVQAEGSRRMAAAAWFNGRRGDPPAVTS